MTLAPGFYYFYLFTFPSYNTFLEVTDSLIGQVQQKRGIITQAVYLQLDIIDKRCTKKSHVERHLEMAQPTKKKQDISSTLVDLSWIFPNRGGRIGDELLPILWVFYSLPVVILFSLLKGIWILPSSSDFANAFTLRSKLPSCWR